MPPGGGKGIPPGGEPAPAGGKGNGGMPTGGGPPGILGGGNGGILAGIPPGPGGMFGGGKGGIFGGMLGPAVIVVNIIGSHNSAGEGEDSRPPRPAMKGGGIPGIPTTH